MLVASVDYKTIELLVNSRMFQEILSENNTRLQKLETPDTLLISFTNDTKYDDKLGYFKVPLVSSGIIYYIPPSSVDMVYEVPDWMGMPERLNISDKVREMVRQFFKYTKDWEFVKMWINHTEPKYIQFLTNRFLDLIAYPEPNTKKMRRLLGRYLRPEDAGKNLNILLRRCESASYSGTIQVVEYVFKRWHLSSKKVNKSLASNLIYSATYRNGVRVNPNKIVVIHKEGSK